MAALLWHNCVRFESPNKQTNKQTESKPHDSRWTTTIAQNPFIIFWVSICWISTLLGSFAVFIFRMMLRVCSILLSCFVLCLFCLYLRTVSVSSTLHPPPRLFNVISAGRNVASSLRAPIVVSLHLKMFAWVKYCPLMWTITTKELCFFRFLKKIWIQGLLWIWLKCECQNYNCYHQMIKLSFKARCCCFGDS